MDPVYPVLFVDAIVVKVRDGQVRNTPFYVVMGVTVNGEREILGIWAGDGAEGARFWLQVFSELKNRGVEDVCIAVCDGLKGLPDAVKAKLSQAIAKVMTDPAVHERLAKLDITPDVIAGPALYSKLESEIKNWARLIDAKGIKAE